MGQREDRPGFEQDMEHLAVVDKGTVSITFLHVY